MAIPPEARIAVEPLEPLLAAVSRLNVLGNDGAIEVEKEEIRLSGLRQHGRSPEG